MTTLSPYDDPAVLDKFLQVIQGKSQSARSKTSVNNGPSKLSPQCGDFSPRISVTAEHVESGLNTVTGAQAAQSLDQQESVASILKPPPFPQTSDTDRSAALDLVQDEQDTVTETATRTRPLTPTQHRLLVGRKRGIEHLTEGNLAELGKQTQGYIDNVVDQFRKSKGPDFAQPRVATSHRPSDEFKAAHSLQAGSSLRTVGNPDKANAAAIRNTDETPVNASENDRPIKSSDQQDCWHHESPDRASCITPVVDPAFHQDSQQHMNNGPKQVDELTDVVPFPTHVGGPNGQTFGNLKGLGDDYCASADVAKAEDERLSTSTAHLKIDNAVENDSDKDGVPVTSGVHDNDSPPRHTQSPTIVVTASTDTDESVEDENNDEENDEEEDRENLVRFRSWGTPVARNKPKSRPRTVILTGLPRGADFMLVQSLIHGGAIEGMMLVASIPERTTIAAHVTFASADACECYCGNYPRGMEIRHQGRKWSVLVHKKEQVDVISGMLQGYLDCGATRVVKVSGADDDWGIVALNKLAEGKPGTRQVEAVQDTYRNGIRTIVFRFANISHAVQFKAHLIRSDDWYGCHVEFAEDPCEKATGIHYD
ncbi:hypothetical protein AYO21_07706 [Fonsecaea monophora]|uniref:Uncharacterized protein n=1 Tax=Fonsecaea monophora TaxID=254056 RepID=A0A177F2R3_9EURO|nr:hypothetical protein AYO21_07706 [Fonsecaea monophora]KAH0847718.1 hypothetical protein FOPE_00939 [Fonsecaea pedrosoi]OAG38116.1 hypothetical protein AYO21_07706 [Fonsecaea monophora]